MSINSCRDRYFRLKALFDIAETVDRCHDLDWQRLSRKADKYQVTHIVYAALWAAERTVGLCPPPGSLEALRVGPVRKQLIHRLVQLILQRASSGSFREGYNISGRSLSPTLLLPYMTYSFRQMVHKWRYLWRTRAGASLD